MRADLPLKHLDTSRGLSRIPEFLRSSHLAPKATTDHLQYPRSRFQSRPERRSDTNDQGRQDCRDHRRPGESRAVVLWPPRTGRRPAPRADSVVSEWRSNGGDQVRQRTSTQWPPP